MGRLVSVLVFVLVVGLVVGGVEARPRFKLRKSMVKLLSDEEALGALNGMGAHRPFKKAHLPLKIVSLGSDPFSSGISLSPRHLRELYGNQPLAMLSLNSVQLTYKNTIFGPGSSDKLRLSEKSHASIHFWPQRVLHGARKSPFFMLRFKYDTMSAAEIKLGDEPLSLTKMADGTRSTVVEWSSAEPMTITLRPKMYWVNFEWVRLTRVE